MKKRIFSLLTMAVLALTLAAPAPADVLVLNYTGEFDGATTLNGTPLGGATPFSFRALFDSAANLFVDPLKPGEGGFLAVVTFTLGDAAPYDALLMIVLLQAPVANFGYIMTLLDMNSDTLASVFTTATPSFSGDNPIGAILTDNLISFRPKSQLTEIIM